MEAIENSMAQRADLLEFDCQLTRDGVVVVSHDKNLSRQSGLNKDINTLDFAQLPLYKEELEIYFSPGHFAHGSDRHMISLEDVFQKFPRTPMCLEIKEKNEELIHKVANMARRFNRNEITIWTSEKNSIMKRCKAALEVKRAQQQLRRSRDNAWADFFLLPHFFGPGRWGEQDIPFWEQMPGCFFP
ncbi:rCG40036, isoform CRA_g, partial [Rattus norvegicus]